jgi:Flp pilus assembly protein TadD
MDGWMDVLAIWGRLQYGQTHNQSALKDERDGIISPKVNSQAGALKAAFEHIRNGDNKAAAQSITREFGDTPSDPPARHLLGLAFLNEPNFSTAVPHLEQAARYAPDQPIIWSHLCQGYAGNRNHAAADRAARRAMILAPAHPGASSTALKLIVTPDTKAASWSLWLGLTEAKNRLAHVLTLIHRGALKSAAQLLGCQPTDNQAGPLLAELVNQSNLPIQHAGILDRLASAIDDWEHSAFTKGKSSEDSMLRRGLALLAFGRPRDAAAQIEVFCRSFDDQRITRAYQNIAVGLAGNFERADELIARHAREEEQLLNKEPRQSTWHMIKFSSLLGDTGQHGAAETDCSPINILHKPLWELPDHAVLISVDWVYFCRQLPLIVMSWSRFVGQFGGFAKVYSGC